jgi:hypothetical protein
MKVKAMILVGLVGLISALVGCSATVDPPQISLEEDEIGTYFVAGEVLVHALDELQTQHTSDNPHHDTEVIHTITSLCEPRHTINPIGLG